MIELRGGGLREVGSMGFGCCKFQVDGDGERKEVLDP